VRGVWPSGSGTLCRPLIWSVVRRTTCAAGVPAVRFRRDVLTRRGLRRSCSHRRTARPLSTGCLGPTRVRPSEGRELASPISAMQAGATVYLYGAANTITAALRRVAFEAVFGRRPLCRGHRGRGVAGADRAAFRWMIDNSSAACAYRSACVGSLASSLTTPELSATFSTAVSPVSRSGHPSRFRA
jgi:hypothetical protein